MSIIIPRFTASFQCPLTLAETMNRIEHCAAEQANHLKKAESFFDMEPGTYCVRITPYKNIWIRNSFSPVINIKATKKENYTHVFIEHELDPETLVFIKVYYSLLLVFEIIMLFYSLRNGLPTRWFLYAPIGIGLCLYLTSTFGLYFPARRVTRIICNAILKNECERLPVLKKR